MVILVHVHSQERQLDVLLTQQTFSATHIHNTINHLFVLHIQHVHCSLNVQGERELPKGERNGCITDISPHSSNNLTRQYWETYHTGSSLGLFQRALCPLGPLLVCPKTNNVPFGSTSKLYFNSHLNYLDLKTVRALNIELSDHWTQLKCFVDSSTHATNVLY